MILTCPQCATRYQADGSKFPAAGRNVRCAKCGHVWHQLGPVPEPDPEAEIAVQPPLEQSAPQPEPEADRPAPVIERPRVAAFAPPVHEAEDDYADDTAAPPPARRRAGFGIIAGWIGLVVLVLLIGTAAVSFRDSIAT